MNHATHLVAVHKEYRHMGGGAAGGGQEGILDIGQLCGGS